MANQTVMMAVKLPQDLDNAIAAAEKKTGANRSEVTRAAIAMGLTVAHLGTPHADGRPGDKHDKHDCRPENLAALCQRCHLAFDLADHVRHGRATRQRHRLQREPLLPGIMEEVTP